MATDKHRALYLITFGEEPNEDTEDGDIEEDPDDEEDEEEEDDD